MIWLCCGYQHTFIEKLSVPWKKGSLQKGFFLIYLMLFFFFFKYSQLPEHSCPCSKIQNRFLFQESSKWKCLETISNKRFGLRPCKEFTFGLAHGKKCESTLTKKKIWKKSFFWGKLNIFSMTIIPYFSKLFGCVCILEECSMLFNLSLSQRSCVCSKSRAEGHGEKAATGREAWRQSFLLT